MKKILMVCLLTCSQAIQAQDAMELLADSDTARGGLKDGLEWVGTIETTENGESHTREFKIRAQGHDAYVEALSPAKNKGEVFLFNDRQMWFYKPSLKKPVAISARQKLSGQAANGDIASTHYARDYTAVLEKTEDLKGVKHHVLLLKAKSKNMTYDQIRYWINDKTKLATQAEFLTLQGQPFKRGFLEYANTLQVGGKSIPFVSQLTIIDAKFENNRSVIRYAKPRITQHPASLFNYNSMTR